MILEATLIFYYFHLHLLNFAPLMSHELYMKRCLELAQKGKGNTTPNPMVGAVLVHNGRIIGEGWHHVYGNVHAEVDCLNNVIPEDQHLIAGSTMYVSLEPCAHTGKTPPCASRLVKEQIAKVVIANKDPFELVKGKGIDILKNAGIDVVTGVCEQEGFWVNRRFFCMHTQNRPYIILKWAQTTDGFMAPADKSRFQITNEHSKQLLHKWRTEEAAIMVGSNTAINDNPQLTARIWQGKQPLRIALTRSGVLPDMHQLLDNAAPTWIVNEQTEKTVNNVRFIKLNFDETLLNNLMSVVHQHNITSLIVEGGAQLLNSFINNDLWDEARIFTGTVNLGNGLAAPLLTNSNIAFTTYLDRDTLRIVTNRKSKYPYVHGLEL